MDLTMKKKDVKKDAVKLGYYYDEDLSTLFKTKEFYYKEIWGND